MRNSYMLDLCCDKCPDKNNVRECIKCKVGTHNVPDDKKGDRRYEKDKEPDI